MQLSYEMIDSVIEHFLSKNPSGQTDRISFYCSFGVIKFLRFLSIPLISKQSKK
jgi:hypothetical protein